MYIHVCIKYLCTVCNIFQVYMYVHCADLLVYGLNFLFKFSIISAGLGISVPRFLHSTKSADYLSADLYM